MHRVCWQIYFNKLYIVRAFRITSANFEETPYLLMDAPV